MSRHQCSVQPFSPALLRRALTLFLLTVGNLGFGQGFTDGDVYLLDDAYATTKVLQRLDPVTYDVTDLALLDGVNTTMLTYDRFRDRLVLHSQSISEFILIDALGNVTTLDYDMPPGLPSYPNAICSGGDGRLFVYAQGFIGYVDACDEFHLIQGAFGPAPYQLELSPWFGASRMAYDVGTNALFLAGPNSSGSGAQTTTARVPLNPAGTQIGGPVEQFVFDASPSAEDVVAINGGPDGTLMVFVDLNGGGSSWQAFTVDPVTGTCTGFAYMQSNSMHAGCYSSVTDLAYTVHNFGPTATEVHTHALGEVGPGTLIAESLPDPCLALICIGDEVASSAFIPVAQDCDGNGVDDACDIAEGTASDCNDNGIPDSCDIASGVAVDSNDDGIIDDCEIPSGYAEGWIYALEQYGTTSQIIQRIDPVTRDVYDFAEVDTTSSSLLTYDPFRDGLIVDTPSYSFSVDLLRADGTTEELSWAESPEFGSEVYTVAPTGDGRIYAWSNNSPHRLGYFDACNQFQLVLNESDDDAYTFAEGYGVGRIIYDVGTNSIVTAGVLGFGEIKVSRIPLSEDGSRLDGPVETASYLTAMSSAAVRGISAGPDPEFITLVFDVNGGPVAEQIVTVHVPSLIVQPYAELLYSAFYAGSYHSGVDAVICYWAGSWGFHNLVTFDYGDTGEGTVFTSGIVAPGALIVIGETVSGEVPPAPGALDCNSNGVSDACDIQLGTSSDCNGNGIPDECELADGSEIDSNGNGILDSCEPHFIRGDLDGAGAVEISDAVMLLDHLFLDGSVPCAEAGDIDDDDNLQLNDPLLLLGYLFQQGPPPASPFPSCGVDGTGGLIIGCENPPCGD